MSHIPKLQRTPALWTMYALLGLYPFLLAALGPAVPLLRAEFHFDYTMAALHLSAFAVGMVLSGFVTPWVIRRFGDRGALWGGQVGILLGITGLVLAPAPWVSLVAILFAGVTGTVSLSANQGLIARTAGVFRGKALLEANVFSSLAAASTPFVLIAGTALGLGWRVLWPVFFLALALTFLLGWKNIRRATETKLDHTTEGPEGALPPGFGLALALILVGVSVEWGIAFWAAEYLQSMPGATIGLATAGAGLLQVSAVLGRWASSRIVPVLGEKKLLLLAMGLVALGFPLYWTLAHPALVALGLVLCGLGISSFYPLGLTLALGRSDHPPHSASALASGASGVSMLAAPLVLGAMADHFSLTAALLAVPAGLLIMLVLLGLPPLLRKAAAR